MNIWNILDIEPTTNKKAIRKAYAAKTREIHPEEKPEEFKELHAAYQAALCYAESILKGNSFPEIAMAMNTAEKGGGEKSAEDINENTSESVSENAAEDAAKDNAGDRELLSFFADHQEKHQKRVDEFIQYWAAFQSPYRDPGVLVWWEEYLNSERFQEICFHPQVLHLLAEEIDNKFLYGINEVKLLFWDAYGFQGDEGTVLQGDQQRLWRSLYPAYENRLRNRENERRRAKYDKAIRILVGVSVAAVLAICIFIPVNIHRQREQERLALIAYMAQMYPEAGFAEPERAEKENSGDIGGNIIYTMRPSAHPEFSVTAKVEYQYANGEKSYLVTEDYGQQLFEYYAAQYGLDAYGGQIYNIIFYPDIEQIDTFCESVERMFSEQEELHTISETAVCAEDVLFPEILMMGNVQTFSFSDPQFYDLRHMKASELSAALRKAYMVYMFQFESWNITPQQYREWGAAYEKICEEWEDDNGEWHEVYDPNTGEYLCRLFIPTYQRYDGYYGPVGNMPGIPRTTRMITVGNAYYFLQDREANLSVSGDGGGFTVKFYGIETEFGLEPEVEFPELRNYY